MLDKQPYSETVGQLNFHVSYIRHFWNNCEIVEEPNSSDIVIRMEILTIDLYYWAEEFHSYTIFGRRIATFRKRLLWKYNLS